MEQPFISQQHDCCIFVLLCFSEVSGADKQSSRVGKSSAAFFKKRRVQSIMVTYWMEIPQSPSTDPPCTLIELINELLLSRLERLSVALAPHFLVHYFGTRRVTHLVVVSCVSQTLCLSRKKAKVHLWNTLNGICGYYWKEVGMDAVTRLYICWPAVAALWAERRKKMHFSVSKQTRKSVDLWWKQRKRIVDYVV